MILKIVFVFLFFLSISVSPKEIPTTERSAGIIVSFKNWPTKKEKAILLEMTEKYRLEKRYEFKIIKAWGFHWPEARGIEESNEICKKVEILSFVKFCEADRFVSIAN